MTYKEKLIMFLKMKNSVIRKYSNKNRCSISEYIDQKDIYEIENWTKNICSQVYKYIVKHVDSSVGAIYHAQTCPWCIYYFNIKGYKNCSSCKYGKRNGVCSNPSSRYKKLTEAEAFVPLTKNKYIEIIDEIENKAEDSDDL